MVWLQYIQIIYITPSLVYTRLNPKLLTKRFVIIFLAIPLLYIFLHFGQLINLLHLLFI